MRNKIFPILLNKIDFTDYFHFPFRCRQEKKREPGKHLRAKRVPTSSLRRLPPRAVRRNLARANRELWAWREGQFHVIDGRGRVAVTYPAAL
jgi:hypothetical protein